MILLLAHQRPDGDVDTYHLKPGRRYHIGRGSGCEVRILDLKLSRKHAVVEYLERAWHFVDLGSTNGCTVNDILADEPVALREGATIALGQTVLRVVGLVPPAAADPVYRKQPSDEFRPEEAATNADQAPRIEPLTAIRSATPVATPAGATAPPLAVEAVSRSSSRMRAAVAPSAPAAPAAPAASAPAGTGSSALLAAVPPDAAPPAVTTLMDDRPFFITVLGTRIGPLTKVQARDLKARELRGELSARDLEPYPKV